jgi:hypothetical protein
MHRRWRLHLKSRLPLVFSVDCIPYIETDLHPRSESGLAGLMGHSVQSRRCGHRPRRTFPVIAHIGIVRVVVSRIESIRLVHFGETRHNGVQRPCGSGRPRDGAASVRPQANRRAHGFLKVMRTLLLVMPFERR